MPLNTQAYDEAVTNFLNKIMVISHHMQLIPEDLIDFIDLIEQRPKDADAKRIISPIIYYKTIIAIPLSHRYDCLQKLSEQLYQAKKLHKNHEISCNIGFTLWLEVMALCYPDIRIFSETMSWLLANINDVNYSVLKFIYQHSAINNNQKLNVTAIRANKLYHHLTNCFLIEKSTDDLPIIRAHAILKKEKLMREGLPLTVRFLTKLASFNDTTSEIYKQLVDGMNDANPTNDQLRSVCNEIGVPPQNDPKLLKASFIIFCLLKEKPERDKGHEIIRLVILMSCLADFRGHELEFAPLYKLYNKKLAAEKVEKIILHFLHQYLLLHIKELNEKNPPNILDKFSPELIDYIRSITLSTHLIEWSPQLTSFLSSQFLNEYIKNLQTLSSKRGDNLDKIVIDDMAEIEAAITAADAPSLFEEVNVAYAFLETKFPWLNRYIDKTFFQILAYILPDIGSMQLSKLVSMLRDMEAYPKKNILAYLLEIFSKIQDHNIGAMITIAYCLHHNFISQNDVPLASYENIVQDNIGKSILTPHYISVHGLSFCLFVVSLINIIDSNEENVLEGIAWQALLNKTQDGFKLELRDHVNQYLYHACGIDRALDFRLLCIRHILDISKIHSDKNILCEAYNILENVIEKFRKKKGDHQHQYQFIADFLEVDIYSSSDDAPIYLQIITLLNYIEEMQGNDIGIAKLQELLCIRLISLFQVHPDVSQITFPARYDKYFKSTGLFDRFVDLYYLTHSPIDMGTAANVPLEHSAFFIKLAQHHTEWNVNRIQHRPYIQRMSFPDYTLYIFLIKAHELKDELAWQIVENIIYSDTFVMPSLLPFHFREYDNLQKLQLLALFNRLMLLGFPKAGHHNGKLILRLLALLHNYPEVSILPCLNELHIKLKDGEKLIKLLSTKDCKSVYLYLKIQIYAILLNYFPTEKFTISWNALDNYDSFKEKCSDLREFIPHGFSNAKKLRDALIKNFPQDPATIDSTKLTKEKSTNKQKSPTKTPSHTQTNDNKAEQQTVSVKINPEDVTYKNTTKEQKDLALEKQCLEQIIRDLKQIAFGGEFHSNETRAYIDYSLCRNNNRLQLTDDVNTYDVDESFIESQVYSRLSKSFSDSQITLNGLRIEFKLDNLKDLHGFNILNALPTKILNYLKKCSTNKIRGTAQMETNQQQQTISSHSHEDEPARLGLQDNIKLLVIFLRNILGRKDNDTLFSTNNIQTYQTKKRFGFKFSVKGMSRVRFENLDMYIETAKLMKYLEQLINEHLSSKKVCVYDNESFIRFQAEISFVNIIKNNQPLIDKLKSYVFNFVLKQNEKPLLTIEQEKTIDIDTITKFMLSRFPNCIATDNSISFNIQGCSALESDDFISQALLCGFQIHERGDKFVLDLSEIIEPDFNKFFSLFSTSNSDVINDKQELQPNTDLTIKDDPILLDQLRKHASALADLTESMKPSAAAIIFNLKRLFVLLQLAHRTQVTTNWRNKFIHYPSHELEHIAEHIHFVKLLINWDFFSIIQKHSLSVIITKFISINEKLKDSSLYKYLETRFAHGNKASNNQSTAVALYDDYQKLVASALHSAEQLLLVSATMNHQMLNTDFIYYLCVIGSGLSYLKKIDIDRYQKLPDKHILNRFIHYRVRMFHTPTPTDDLPSPRSHIEKAKINFATIPTKGIK